MPNNIAIIFAGGIGKRMSVNENSLPKQFLKINNKPIIIHTLELFQNHSEIDKIYISIHSDYYDFLTDLVKYYYIDKVKGIVTGGKTGQDSIYKALKLAAAENDKDSLVLIHDGVRPNITKETISKNISMAKEKGNAVTCTPCFETILISENHINPLYVPYRKDTFAAQAPQTFHLGEVLDLHEIMRKQNPEYDDIVDTCTLYKSFDKQIYMVEGNLGNIKITTIEDLYLLRALIRFKEDIDAFGLNNIKTEDINNGF